MALNGLYPNVIPLVIVDYVSYIDPKSDFCLSSEAL